MQLIRIVSLAFFVLIFSVACPQANDLRAIRALAERGNAGAQYKLGKMYYDGHGVPQDYAEAMRWYRKAADQGDADAQAVLGVMYNHGVGVPRDYVEAVRWYRRAADQGDARAQRNLGWMYGGGFGVPQDYVHAHMWFNLAASRAQGWDQEWYATSREAMSSKMTPQQIAEAQRLAREWKPKPEGK